MAWMYPGTTGYGTALSESLSRNTWCYFCSRHRMNGRKLFLMSAVMAESLILMGASCASMYEVSVHSASSPVDMSHVDPCLISNLIIILLTLAAIVHAIRGILKENVTEMAAYVVSVSVACIFIVIDYRSHMKLLPALVSMYTCAIGTPICILLARFACCKFKCHRIVGAADSLRYMYEERTHLLVIMRMDLVFMIVYALVSFSLNTRGSFYGYYTCCAIILLSLLKWIIGKVALMREVTPLLNLYVILTMMSHLWIPVHLLLSLCFTDSCGRGRREYSYLSTAAAAAIIFDQVYIMVYLLRVFRNFGYGLTDRGE